MLYNFGGAVWLISAGRAVVSDSETVRAVIDRYYPVAVAALFLLHLFYYCDLVGFSSGCHFVAPVWLDFSLAETRVQFLYPPRTTKFFFTFSAFSRVGKPVKIFLIPILSVASKL